jgi:hypothetical protein
LRPPRLFMGRGMDRRWRTCWFMIRTRQNQW